MINFGKYLFGGTSSAKSFGFSDNLPFSFLKCHLPFSVIFRFFGHTVTYEIHPRFSANLPFHLSFSLEESLRPPPPPPPPRLYPASRGFLSCRFYLLVFSWLSLLLLFSFPAVLSPGYPRGGPCSLVPFKNWLVFPCSRNFFPLVPCFSNLLALYPPPLEQLARFML